MLRTAQFDGYSLHSDIEKQVHPCKWNKCLVYAVKAVLAGQLDPEFHCQQAVKLAQAAGTCRNEPTLK